jgi:5-formyltetrahydrofolate cyclo-ligase
MKNIYITKHIFRKLKFKILLQKCNLSMNNKSIIRNKLNQQRASLTSDQVKQMSLRICDNILSSDVFNKSDCIAMYFALFNEVNLSSLLQTNKNLCLPVVQADKAMTFHQYDENTVMSKNKYGILEPQNGLIIAANDIDLCLMPLVGFNRNGDRQGMGGGYYDRYFADNKTQEKPTILAGIAYDFQEDDTIQSELWDIPLDMIFTNKEVIYCGQPR